MAVGSCKSIAMQLIRYADGEGMPVYGMRGDDGEFYRTEVSASGERVKTEEKADLSRLLAPVVPPAIYCVAVNYADHGKELDMQKSDEFPTIFMKAPTTVIGPGQAIEIPRGLRSDKADYEGELVIVIGKPCKNVSKEDAMDYVLGFTIANDVTAREWQKEHGGGQFCRGKTFDTFCPLGPVIVSADEIADVQNLAITTKVNGEIRQASNTSEMIFDVPTLVSFLSGSNTLLAGTIIMTGTPAGVGVGMNPPQFLQVGDVVEIEIEGIGTLSNPVVEEVV